MRVFLAGATDVIGRRLVPLLVASGHEVTGMSRSAGKQAQLRVLGAQPVIADALDATAVRAAVAEARPDAVIHQLTALPQRIDPRRIVRDFELNDRLRGEGTRILVDAAQAAGAGRIVAQSIAFAYAPSPPPASRRGGGGDANRTLHVERDPLIAEQAPKDFRRTARAVRELEDAVLGAGGVALRYGYFYGPGSAISSDGSVAQDIARRRLPVIGKGQGVWSFIHVDDAAQAAADALTRGPPGAYNIVDDEPAPVAQWLPALAEALGAPRPLKVPAPLARLAAGGYAVITMTRSQGASNALAKSALGWTPRHPSWREGFRTALG